MTYKQDQELIHYNQEWWTLNQNSTRTTTKASRFLERELNQNSRIESKSLNNWRFRWWIQPQKPQGSFTRNENWTFNDQIKIQMKFNYQNPKFWILFAKNCKRNQNKEERKCVWIKRKCKRKFSTWSKTMHRKNKELN